MALPSTPVTPVAKTGFRKLSENEWLEIVNLAEQGESIPKIAKVFDVHHSILYRGLKKRKVRLGGNAKEAAEEAAKQAREDLIKKIKEAKEQDYRFTQALQQMAMTTLIDARKSTVPGGPAGRVGAVLEDIKAIKLAMDTIKNGTANKWKILGLDDENHNADEELPELPIRELTELEVQAIRDRQMLEDGLEDLPEGIEDEDTEIEIEDSAEEEAEPESAF